MSGRDLPGIDPVPVRLVGSSDISLARRAHVNGIASEHCARRLEKALLAVLIAIWTKPMRWFGAASIWLQHVGHRPSKTHGLQFIALLLSIPCFEASNFCFKRVYLINLRRMG